MAWGFKTSRRLIFNENNLASQLIWLISCRGANANVTITPTKGKTAPWSSPKVVETYEPLRIPKVSSNLASRPLLSMESNLCIIRANSHRKTRHSPWPSISSREMWHKCKTPSPTCRATYWSFVHRLLKDSWFAGDWQGCAACCKMQSSVRKCSHVSHQQHQHV